MQRTNCACVTNNHFFNFSLLPAIRLTKIQSRHTAVSWQTLCFKAGTPFQNLMHYTVCVCTFRVPVVYDAPILHLKEMVSYFLFKATYGCSILDRHLSSSILQINESHSCPHCTSLTPTSTSPITLNMDTHKHLQNEWGTKMCTQGSASTATLQAMVWWECDSCWVHFSDSCPINSRQLILPSFTV